ncbi:hypothetical protein VP01_2129g5 [Puccinia sorghi]|uniref:OTU domain-containing protein n=1 Tax=Puccinia sorghi TaxID=27349 RepID=A0A0L6VBQ4_9BASI|nr:hypothetical protein VP01_2129g5 [Puccinia sorghi]
MIQNIVSSSQKYFIPTSQKFYLDFESDGHCGFRVVSYCLGFGQHEHLAVRNKLYQHTKERSQCFNQMDCCEEYLLLLPEILHPYISNVLDFESDGHRGFRVVSYCLGFGQHEHLAVQNKLYQHTKERIQWYKYHSYIDNISSFLNMIKF